MRRLQGCDISEALDGYAPGQLRGEAFEAITLQLEVVAYSGVDWWDHDQPPS